MVKINQNLFNLLGFLLVVILICKSCEAAAKYEETPQNPYPNNQWRRASTYKANDTAAEPSSVTDRTERLGFSTGYGTQGYPYSGSGVGVYQSPIKLDIGGIVIGAIIGIGAILIVPKIVGIINGGYGGNGANYRSAVDSDPTGLAEMLTKLDDILKQNNIDSTTCVQRTVCSYVRSSEYHMQLGTADQYEQLIHMISGNALVDYMLDGTAIKQAVENGKKIERDCDAIYPGCPLDKENFNSVLTKMLPNGGN